MLALLSSGDSSFLFTHLFLRQLPPLVRTALATSDLIRTKDYRRLAKEADKLLLASRQFSVHALVPPNACEEDVCVHVTAVTDRRDKKESLCFYHRRFGTKARRCIPPCSFQQSGNRKAGAR
ncbi:unnamed protein product [Knipowitschia caucasica]